MSQAGGADAGDDDMDLDSAKFKYLSSPQKLKVLITKKPPLSGVLAGGRLGRSEGPVRRYLTNGVLADPEVKLLRNHLKQVVRYIRTSVHEFWGTRTHRGGGVGRRPPPGFP